ncbi:hypothetical protein R1sor_024577 [Riccia sorocarpa]|uniref:Triacylglycerol lipase n=1 Tax=Riccia sorocarpa TaxID=122646 RepID=A0ABD3GSG1_9MARC
MLLNPAYPFDEEYQEFSYHSFIMRDFQEYATLFAKGVLEISGEELVQYLHDVDKELDGITCLDGSIWTHIHREKALSERCRTSLMHWWAQAGRGAPKLRVIAMNILGLTCAAFACERAWSSYAYVHSLSRVRLSIPRQHKLVYIYHNARVNNIDQKRERKSAAVLNTFMKSNTQQSILKQRHGTEYGWTSNPRDAWIPDDVLQENGPEIALSNGDRVRVKTWDWTEPVNAEEVLEDTLQARTMRNAPVDGKLPVGSTEPMENIVYYDDLADHDFPDDSEMSLDDSAVLRGMEVRDENTLDASFDVTSEVLPMEGIRNYTIVDDIDTTKAWTLGVGQERLKQLNSRFGVARFPHVTLNVPGITLTTKKMRILQEIYSMLGQRTDSFDLGKPPKRPNHSSSRLKPTERAGTSRQWENVVGPGEKNTQVFIFTDRARDARAVVVAWRGTELFNTLDWSTDFDFSWIEIEGLGKVHVGFLEALGLGDRNRMNTFVKLQNRAGSERAGGNKDEDSNLSGLSNSVKRDKYKKLAYDHVTKILKIIIRKNPNAKLFITGHSLGGALANLYTGLLFFNNEEKLTSRLAAVYTFGQPRVGAEDYSEYLISKLNEKRYWRVVYSNDLVPRIPFDLVPRIPFDGRIFKFKHSGYCYFYDERFTQATLKDVPNRNYFSWKLSTLIEQRVGAMYDLILSVFSGWIYGPDFREGWIIALSRPTWPGKTGEKIQDNRQCGEGLTMRCAGLIAPGMGGHLLTNYVNAVRLGPTVLENKLNEHSSFGLFNWFFSFLGARRQKYSTTKIYHGA